MIKRSYKFYFIGLSVLSLAAAGYVWWNLGQDKSYTDQKTVSYGFTVRNLTSELIDQGEVYILAPVARTAYQKVENIQSNLPYVLVNEESGNRLLKFTLRDLPPFGAQIINIRVNVAFSEEPILSWMDLLLGEDTESYLGPAPFIESNHPRIVNQAVQFKSGTKLEIAKKTYSWVAHRISNKGYIERDRGALFALESGAGDCTEFMYLYTALARANDIPTRGVAGFIVNENGPLKPDGYHNWAESYLDGAWRSVDADKKKFMDRSTRYLAFKLMENDGSSIRNATQSMAYSTHYLSEKLSISMSNI